MGVFSTDYRLPTSFVMGVFSTDYRLPTSFVMGVFSTDYRLPTSFVMGVFSTDYRLPRPFVMGVFSTDYRLPTSFVMGVFSTDYRLPRPFVMGVFSTDYRLPRLILHPLHLYLHLFFSLPEQIQQHSCRQFPRVPVCRGVHQAAAYVDSFHPTPLVHILSRVNIYFCQTESGIQCHNSSRNTKNT